MTAHLHFTFGPVQGFVAQARRTRDLFSGSFLLSYLALTAMRAAKNNGGTILLPKIEVLEKLVADNVKHASAPNRFVAEFSDDKQAANAAQLATEALKAKWRKIAAAVWEKFVAAAESSGNGTVEIWKRQIENFWDISWVVGSPDKKGNPDGRLLDRRKNWRTPPLITEFGDHCSLMGEWQELSGFIRSQQRRKQDDFWGKVRKNIGNTLNLESGERLCAIAFVKRFFPEVVGETTELRLDAQSWPSTVLVAALPWLRKIAAKPAVHDEALKYADFVKNEPGAVVGMPDIPLLKNFPSAAGKFKRLSGNFLNQTSLQNEQGTPLRSATIRTDILGKLRDLGKDIGGHADRAGNFYALLLMDGDRMGKLIRDHGAESVTAALTEFSTEISNTVRENDGTTVYAGGDDLLALLPLDRALACAADAAKLYKEIFAKIFAKNNISPADASISAAIVFAHYRVPLRRVLHRAHHLLDDVAKDKTGRDAIAISIFKPGGETCQWTAKFEKFTCADSGSVDTKNIFAPLIKKFRDDNNGTTVESNDNDGGAVTLSSKFLYNLHSRFEDFKGTHGDFVKLFTAELLHGRLAKDPDKAKKQRETAEKLMEKLTDICTPSPKPPKEEFTPDFSGLRLVRFLALDGKEGHE
jgi:CRISPR-associated protein Cmr2